MKLRLPADRHYSDAPMTLPSAIDAAAARWLGAPQPVLLIAGHSHRHAFFDYFNRSGQTAAIAILDQRDPVAILNTAASSVDSDPYWALALSSARERSLPLAIVWDGNQHNAHFLLEPDETFSIFPATGPWDDGLPRPLVPRALVQELFAPGLAGLRAVLSKAAGIKVLLIGTPPPKADEQIRAGIDKEPLLVEAAERLGMTAASLRITPLPVRMELWTITQALLRATADEFSATYVRVPERALSNGALAADASLPDATHANGLWAEIMIHDAREALAPV